MRKERKIQWQKFNFETQQQLGTIWCLILLQVSKSLWRHILQRYDKKAKEIGCDCVKFQSWTADTLYSKTYYDENPIANGL